MSTKYRTRAKRAFKKLDGIERRQLSHAEIQMELPTIYHLYREIANNAGFNMVDLNEQYLAALERDLGEHFRMFAYYLDGKLIAISTSRPTFASMVDLMRATQDTFPCRTKPQS